MTTRTPLTPAQAWADLRAGNERFVAGQPDHPNQDAFRRSRLAEGQAPFATVFGCSDSRLAAELIFDRGLGDLFVIRTAGHVVHEEILGSVEFATDILGAPLIVVLGHDSCGAVRAALEHYRNGTMPGGFIRDIVERITPSVIAAAHADMTTTDDVEAEHVRQTMALIVDRSQKVSAAIEAGRCAVVGLTYALAKGKVTLVSTIGDIGD